MTHSAQQLAIFDWFRSGAGNLVVRARAGTGKTTTILEGIGYAPEERILLAAFNKRIAVEIQRRLSNPRAEAKTLHSLGFGFVTRNWTGVRLDEGGRRPWDLAMAATRGKAADPMVKLVAKLCELGKEQAPLAMRAEELIPIAETFDCEPDADWYQDGYRTEQIAGWAFQAMQLSRERTAVITFADMLFLPLANNWTRGRYGLVVADEAQDMGYAQLLLAERCVAKGGRIAVVGDDRQAIYGFRGADSGSLDRLKAAYKATELPLTTTYRCPRLVVERAAMLVPDYTAAPEAPEGVIDSIQCDSIPETAKPGDFVISRKNAPLARLCLSLLAAGTPANIEGRDMGKGLIAIVRKCKADSMERFHERLCAWELGETKLALDRGKPDKAAEVSDKAEVLRFLAAGLTSTAELEARIGTLFTEGADPSKKVTCSSIHRIKGLEAERVFLLVDTLYPRGRAGADIEEANLEYVACTRAKARLTLVIGLP